MINVDDLLNEISYADINGYQPSLFALKFVEMIKLIHGGQPENKTPVVHYHMLDKFIDASDRDTINMCHRGFAKTTVKMYLIWYIALFGTFPSLGRVKYLLYISDSENNGVTKMGNRLEDTWNDSAFLQKMIPKPNITKTRWDFTNVDGLRVVITGHGAQQKIRGTVENGSRPVMALIDDIVSDEDARSEIAIRNIDTTINNAIEFALHPTKRKVIWSGTPFNTRDPLYKAMESGAYAINLYPVCERFPCSREEFRGSWEDRFTYDAVKRLYDKAKQLHTLDSFNQEMMLRIMSEEDRLVFESDIQWYSRNKLLSNRSAFNFYITSDFAVSDKKSADYAVVMVWALNSLGQWFLVDGVCVRQLMDKTIDDIFRLVSIYDPLSVGVETNGQQGGFLRWIKNEMMTRNIFFNLASEGNGRSEGIRSVSNKFERFMKVLPLFKAGKIHLPSELVEHPMIIELQTELKLVTRKGFKAKHDDAIDALTMLFSMPTWLPNNSTGKYSNSSSDFTEFDTFDEYSNIGSYTV